MAVFVIDKRKKPLMPCSEKRARKLLASGRARVHRLMPFSIRLVDRNVSDCELQPLKMGSFNIQTTQGVIQGISHRYCTLIQRVDGYGYSQIGAMEKATTAAPSPLYLPALKGGVSRGL